jgi:hypothetical protein
MSPTWRDKFLIDQPSFELQYEEAVQMPFARNQCGAPAPHSYGRYCNRPASHQGDHMVTHYKYGTVPGLRWPPEEL